jgi:hypothetical protein
MAKHKTKIIQLDNGREANAVEELRDALRGAPIFVNRNKLVWLFTDGAVFTPPTSAPRSPAIHDLH